jgi:hypothetical protein
MIQIMRIVISVFTHFGLHTFSFTINARGVHKCLMIQQGNSADTSLWKDVC